MQSQSSSIMGYAQSLSETVQAAKYECCLPRTYQETDVTSPREHDMRFCRPRRLTGHHSTRYITNNSAQRTIMMKQHSSDDLRTVHDTSLTASARAALPRKGNHVTFNDCNMCTFNHSNMTLNQMQENASIWNPFPSENLVT